jgi:hypothetical protein
MPLATAHRAPLAARPPPAGSTGRVALGRARRHDVLEDVQHLAGLPIAPPHVGLTRPVERQTRAGRAARDGRTELLSAEKIGRCPQRLRGSPGETPASRRGAEVCQGGVAAEGDGPTTRTEPVMGFCRHDGGGQQG